MAKRMANTDIAGFVGSTRPDIEIEGYGALSYTPRGYYTGHLPRLSRTLYYDVMRRQGSIPTLYSYGTPIAWFDREFGVWIRPDVSYSVTTAKHQGSLWKLGYGTDAPLIGIPRDCGVEEYRRYASQKMTYTRTGTIPGPNYIVGEK